MNSETAIPLASVLIEPAADPRDLRWQDRAACLYVGTAAFFPKKGESSREAKAVCRTCPVRTPCLAYSLDIHEDHGVWGGFSEAGRREAARKYAAGRSPADIIAEDDARFYATAETSEATQAAANERRLAAERVRRAEQAAQINISLKEAS